LVEFGCPINCGCDFWFFAQQGTCEEGIRKLLSWNSQARSLKDKRIKDFHICINVDESNDSDDTDSTCESDEDEGNEADCDKNNVDGCNDDESDYITDSEHEIVLLEAGEVLELAAHIPTPQPVEKKYM
jgi:hypothetical protein